jgi:hypothetical protein
MAFITGIWEAEIRRIMVPGQPRQKVCKTPSQQKKAAHGARTCHTSYGGKCRIVVQASLG